MSKITVTVSRKAHAPAEIVYNVLADYSHHRNILPPQFFIGLDVIEGGIGAGTRFVLHAKALGGGQTQMRMSVTEPQPGSVLVEKDEHSDLVTTFIVKAVETAVSEVTFQTIWQAKPGLKGLIDRWTTPALMRMVYRKEQEILDEYAQQQARLGQNKGLYSSI